MGKLYTRRGFLKEAGSATALVAVGVSCGGEAEEEWPATPNAVGIAHREKIEAAVQAAVALVGGLSDIRSGQTVFIKPNAVHPFVTAPAITTNPEVLAAVVRMVKARGATVVVGDRSARGFDTSNTLDASGLRKAALEAGADEVYAAPTPTEDPSAWMLLQPPGFEETWAAEGGILAMRKILEADHLINVPTCKDHRWAAFSLSMKAHIGAIGDDSRGPIHYMLGEPDRMGRDIAILNQMFSPRLNIIDAWDVLVNGGPDGILADAVRYPARLILASQDRIALDAMGVSLIKLARSRSTIPMPDDASAVLDSRSPWAMPQIVHGRERGLGVASASEVELRFDDVDDAAELEAIFIS
jgi:uncharacterized protein (DUF362 family)